MRSRVALLLTVIPLGLTPACKKASSGFQPQDGGSLRTWTPTRAVDLGGREDGDEPFRTGAQADLDRAIERSGEEIEREAERLGERMNIQPWMTEQQVEREIERGAAQLQQVIERQARELEHEIERAAEATRPAGDFDGGDFDAGDFGGGDVGD